MVAFPLSSFRPASAVMKSSAFVAGLCAIALLGACGADAKPSTTATLEASTSAARPAECPATAKAGSPLPHIRSEHRQVDYWIEQARRYGDPDEVLLGAESITDHNRALSLPIEGETIGHVDLHAPIDREHLAEEVSERLAFLRERFETGHYLESNGKSLGGDLSPFSAVLPSLEPEQRRATGAIALRCGPRVEGFYTPSLDLDFDRNNCSTIREGEPVQLLAEWPGGMRLARTPYAMGWIAADAPLSGKLDAAAFSKNAPRERPLTRRALLQEAFELLDQPYGWGGQAGGLDCSRFLLDVFQSFGLALPRHSGRQAQAGSFAIDVSSVQNAEEKARIIETAAHRGVVLLHFPGHIMLYLGRSAEGEPMALHAFSEYLESCDGVVGSDGKPLETLRRVDRVDVSDLSLGVGTSRGSFLERITRVAVFGKAPGAELAGAAELRPAAPPRVPNENECRDSLDVAIFRSPFRPYPDQPMRVIVTSTRDPGPVELLLLDPDGKRVEVPVHRLGGPPYSYWTQIDHPAAGRWTAILGDGARVEACERFHVVRFPPAVEMRHADAPAWKPSWAWEVDTENFFSAFVEQLFREPEQEDITWKRLQEVISDPKRNLLYNHRSLGEDERIDLEPDCADLPYFLRGYFAWKLRLPFGYRRCARGRAGRPPTCDKPRTNLEPTAGNDEVSAFKNLIRDVARSVHSASARTHPNDEQTDNYPVPLRRETLRPGTVFADPYGHLLVVAAWLPQTAGRYGVLVGADAQPDGTVGRRRFWRGSFLFTPETEDVGAGFKAWRPLVFDARSGTMQILDNRALGSSKTYVPHSLEQYGGSVDDFYDRMESLINPRPLDPVGMQVSLVDALEESLVRRVNSVDNGEQFMASRSYRPIEMPTGNSIFETSGPWEDFSTPSRDMRLLISIAAVLDLGAAVQRNPARFGVEADGLEPVLKSVQARLQSELAARHIEYTRSDGQKQRLSLQEVVDRRTALEVAYNPNDCVETRWAAPEGSPEKASCKRHAPADQRRRMEQYRAWFAARKRPPR